MNTIILVATLVFGLLTLAFIANGVVRQSRGKSAGGARTFLAVTVLSLLTAIFTIWQLALTLGSVQW